MNRAALYFTAPGQVEVREEKIENPGPDQVLVKTILSAISPGTELLIYRGQAPEGIRADSSIPSLEGDLSYPLKYGYAAVGRVISLGADVAPAWLGRLVFSFQPHQSQFVAKCQELIPVPEKTPPEEAVFLPNVETSVNFLMDGQPLIGERVAVFGQGIVGLLTTSLLAILPLEKLITFDLYENRRLASVEAGAQACFDPADVPGRGSVIGNMDLIFELSGSPQALDQAIDLTGFDGRVVVGSWYGTRRTDLRLGGHFHRNRIRLISSQVSTLSPQFSGRWTKDRRLNLAWKMIEKIEPSRFITHRKSFKSAPEAFALLDQSPGQAIQVLFEYH